MRQNDTFVFLIFRLTLTYVNIDEHEVLYFQANDCDRLSMDAIDYTIEDYLLLINLVSQLTHTVGAI